MISLVLLLAVVVFLRGSPQVQGMPRLPLQEAEGKTLCPYTYRPDVLENRTPRILHKVECHGKDVFQEDIVYSYGHYNRTCRCTEIYTQVTVSQHHPNGVVKTSDIHYPVGCACLNLSAHPARKMVADIVHR